MLFLVIERFRSGPKPVYERVHDAGRQFPFGVHRRGSWVTDDLSTCYQLMESPNRSALDSWIAAWNDLVEFEVVEVMSSEDAAERVMGKRPRPDSERPGWSLLLAVLLGPLMLIPAALPGGVENVLYVLPALGVALLLTGCIVRLSDGRVGFDLRMLGSLRLWMIWPALLFGAVTCAAVLLWLVGGGLLLLTV